MKKIKIPILRVALILLLAVVVTAQISTGLSAKYLSKSESTSIGRVAHFESGEISVTSQKITASYSDETATDGYHVYRIDGMIEFPANEVNREFTFDMEITGDDSATFACPSGSVYTLKGCGGSKPVSTADNIDGLDIATLTPGKAYVAYCVIGGSADGLVWHEVDGGTSISLSDTPIEVGMDSVGYVWKVIYFKSFADANGTDSNVNISFNLTTDQVD